MQNRMGGILLLFTLLLTHRAGASPDVFDYGDVSILDWINDALPHSLFDGSHKDTILKLLSGVIVTPDEIGLPHLPDLGYAFDKGHYLRSDILHSIESRFRDGFDFSMDQVAGLFHGEQSDLIDFLSSPDEKFHELFGLTKKCTGPGTLCGDKIPDTCIGPTYSFVVDGGVCVMDDDTGEVVCSRPSISIVKSPATCNLKYDSSATVLVELPPSVNGAMPCAVQGHSCVKKKDYGTEVSRTIAQKGRKLNVTGGDPYQFLGLHDLKIDLDHYFDKR